MGIDIFARWKGQTSNEREAQGESWLSTTAGKVGYLREAYHGEPYATQYLCREAFGESSIVGIPASILRERLPHTLALVAKRERTIYRSDKKTIEEVQQSYRDFVDLCEEAEKERGEPVLIYASY